MFIAHLPAGYLLYRASQRRLPKLPLLVGSICPDFDIALVLIGWLQTNHHHFITHRPATWFCLLALASFWNARWLQTLSIGALLHMSLDSVAGQINWAWPFGDVTLGLVEVLAEPGWWALAFLRHWTFGLELVICATALTVVWRAHNDRKPPA